MEVSTTSDSPALWNYEVAASFRPDADAVIASGDCVETLRSLPDGFAKLIITSPPYNIGKAYEKTTALDRYLDSLGPAVEQIVRTLAPQGSLCWQVGNYVEDGEVFPLDVYFYHLFKQHGLKLRNRIVWHFEHGLHASKRFSGRYETLLWFTKGDTYTFNLDPVRVPSKYPGKTHFKGAKRGQISGNPLGKNPGDLWAFKERKDFTIFPVESHRVAIGVKPFRDLMNFISIIVRQLVNAAAAVPFDRTATNLAGSDENRINLRQDFLRAAPYQANLIFVGGHPYATITIEKAANEVCVEFGRNRWIFSCPSLAGQDSEHCQVERHRFAVNAQSEGSPFIILLNLMLGFPLPPNIIHQLSIFRRKADSEAAVFPATDTTITDDQAEEIGRLRSETAKIFFVESFLSLALHHSRVAITQKPMIMSVTESFGSDNSFADGTNLHQTLPSIAILEHESLIENPSDIWHIVLQDWETALWNIPNVKANHPEKTLHPCQFPIELVERCVLALTDEGDWVLDPFSGVGSSLLAALKNKRRAFGCEKEAEYVEIAKRRINDLCSGTLRYRQLGKPVYQPTGREKVAQIPLEWQNRGAKA